MRTRLTLVGLGILLVSPVTRPAQAGPDPSRPLTLAQIAGASDTSLSLLRNEVYARHGYQFVGTSPRTAFLRDYFSRKAWYHPDTSDSAVVAGRLSKTERRNVDMIVRAEKQRQGSPESLLSVPAMAGSPSPGGKGSARRSARRTAPPRPRPAPAVGPTVTDEQVADLEVYDRIKAKARLEYPGDYVTQKGVYNMAVKAYQQMKAVPDQEIKAQVERDYPDDYITQKGVYDMQVKAKGDMQ